MADEPEATEKPPEAAPAPEAAPQHPDVAAMEDALTRGNFREAQAIARRLTASDDEALREAGRVMLDRFKLDPRVIAVLALTGVLILVLAGLYLGPH